MNTSNDRLAEGSSAYTDLATAGRWRKVNVKPICCGQRGTMILADTREAVSGRTLLLHAHPGHELRLFGWMERHRPTLFLMTDGSGSGAPRTEHSLQSAESAGARPGSVFGFASDRDWYAAILNADTTLFNIVIDAIVDMAIAERVTLIVSDAVDGYNPMHDLCEAVAAAATMHLRRRGQDVSHLAARAVAGGRDDDIVTEIKLDGDAQHRKQAAVDAYTPLAEEVQNLLAEDPEALCREQLRRPTFAWRAQWSPSWENIGASRVASSKYSRRIEYARHVRPLALALLERWAGQPVVNEERIDCAS